MTLLVPEIGGIGRGQGLRRCDAYKGDLFSGRLYDLVGLEHQLSFFIKIAADIGIFRLVRQFQEPVCSIIEFMIAGNGHIVVHGIHQVDHCFALADRAQGFPLDGIAVIHQDGRIPLRLQRIPDLTEPCKPEALCRAAVDITRVEDHDIAVLFDILPLSVFLSFVSGLSLILSRYGSLLPTVLFFCSVTAHSHGKQKRKHSKQTKHGSFSFLHLSAPFE